MIISEFVIGVWPNIPVDPQTGRHAVTGEHVEVPSYDINRPTNDALLERVAARMREQEENLARAEDEIERLRRENAELCMKVYGAPF